MKIAIIGYGKMGRIIEQTALERNHEICLIVDTHNLNELGNLNHYSPDVAIEFTGPNTAVNNYYACFDAGIPVVSGSTGWLSDFEIVTDKCIEKNSGFFYASNFSVGVNLFFELNRKLASLMKNRSDYEVSIEEIHHIHKLDAPSGTAVSLVDGIREINNSYTGHYLVNETPESGKIPIKAERTGEVPGIHKVKYESDIDFIEITHSAKSRKGFALGAILAAEFICGKKGIFGMKDLINS